MKKNPVIALVQMPYTLDDHRIKHYIKKASDRGADIICFPETILPLGHIALTIEEIGRYYGIWCKKYNIWSIFGCVFKQDNFMYNAAILVDNKGTIRGIYYKQHLMGAEKSFPIKQGHSPGIFKTDFGKIGIIICYDMFSPKVISQYEHRKIDILFCLSNMIVPFPEHEERHSNVIDNLASAIPVQLNCFYGLSMTCQNPAIPEKLIAKTQLVSPAGVISKIYNKEGLLVSNISLNDLTFLPQLD